MIKNYGCKLKKPFIQILSPLNLLKSYILKLFRSSAIEAFILTATVLIGSFFMQSVTPLIPLCLIILGKNFFLRFIALIFDNSNLPFKHAVVLILYFFMAANFSVLFNGIAITLIHELGHALGAYIMYVNPHPVIQLFLFSGGATSYVTDLLTPIGYFFGKTLSGAIVSGFGSFITLLISCYLLYFANKRSPVSQGSIYLTTIAIYTVASDALYAHSALINASNGHDFLSLYQVGIHPMLSVFFLLITPLIFTYLMLRN